MFIKVVATTTANAGDFTSLVRQTLRESFPEARIHVRAVHAPSGARMRLVETDCELPSAVENIELLCDAAPEWLALDAA